MKKKYKGFLFLSILFLDLVFLSGVSSIPIDYTAEIERIREFLDDSSSNILRHVMFFSSLGSRVTGYSGYYNATNYIFSYFKQYTDKVYLQNFTVLSPIGEYSLTVTIDKRVVSVKIYPLLPNGFMTGGNQSIEGDLVYVRLGELVDYNGLNLSDKIVLLDFKTGMNWLKYGVMLGPPKAFIFVEPYEFESTTGASTVTEFTRMNVEGQYVSIPLSIPRFYAKFNDIKTILSALEKGALVRGKINGNYAWKSVKAFNVIGFIKGSSLPDKVIVLSAHYDSFSVIPALSPGADESLGISMLLELAKFFSENRPRKSLLFVGFSGHWEGLAGAREFVQRIITSDDMNIRLLIYLALSAYGTDIAILHAGRFYFNPTRGIDFYRAGIVDRLNYYIQTLKIKLYGESTNVDNFIYPGYAWLNLVYGDPLAIFDSEAYTLAGGYGLAIYVPSQKLYWTTPYDNYPKFEEAFRKNILSQKENILYKAASIIAFIVNDVDFTIQPPKYRLFDPNYGGFSTVRGKVLIYNQSTGWYTPAPNTIVRLRVVASMPNSFGLGLYGGLPKIKETYSEGYYSTTGFIMNLTDENGEFVFHGVASSARLGTDYLPAIEYKYIIEAAVLNNKGEIEYFTDYGIHRRDIDFTINSDEKYLTHVVFRCGSIAFYFIIEPETLSIPTIYNIRILEASSHTSPQFYGATFSSFQEGYPVFMVFLQPGVNIELFMVSRSPKEGEPRFLLILNNQGKGFSVNYGILKHVKFTPLRIAEDTYHVNLERYLRMKEQGIKNLEIEDLMTRSRNYILQARKYLYEALRYDFFITFSIESWQINRVVHEKIYYEDLNVKASIMFILILLPFFIYLLERIVFSSKNTNQQIIRISILSVITLSVLYVLHPAFGLMEDIFLLFLGALLSVLMLPAILLSFADFIYALGFLKKKLKGPHFAGISRSGAIIIAISLGSSFIRRRKTRSILLFSTLILVVLGLIIFSFPALTLGVVSRDTYTSPAYTGILVRGQVWQPIPEKYIEKIYSLLSNLDGTFAISSRIWYYPPQELKIRSKNMSIEAYVSAFLGLGPEEASVTGVDGLITRGRWFNDDDYYSCIVDDVAAEYLNLNLSKIALGEEYIELSNSLKLKVVGIIDGELFSSKIDLDGGNFTLIDFKGLVKKPTREKIKLFSYIPTSIIYRRIKRGYFIVIIPAKLARDLGGNIYSLAITVRPLDYTWLDKAARLLTLNLNETYSIYATQLTPKKTQSVYQYFRALIYVFERPEQLVIPIAIGILIIFNSMLSNVYERSKEIETYSALGLSPYHVSGLFLMEALILSVISGVLGYIVGIALAKTINIFNLLPGIYLSYTVNVPVYSTLLSIASTLLASSYPLWRASKMVTPSLERRWKPETKPVGNKWTITLPFVITSRQEADAILKFIKEYLDIHGEGEKYSVLKTSIERQKTATILKVELQMAPYELGIIQEMHLLAVKSREKQFKFILKLHCLKGPISSWRRSSMFLIDDIRKQFLIWRGLTLKEREKYEG
ncbi:MAG: hypothetical protein DRJ47_03290 [Thermoprotei archaeon]|nr:MAG: hypothetical protein DRJ47_03290 [Thermoprotei archaeon]